MNPNRVQSSALVDLKDPIQVHLLTETALSDSKKFEILSQEEVDDLKKQCQSFAQRIEQTRANLTIQSKYRDAAISMAKLYSPTRPDSKRRSLLGNRFSGGESAREAELERQTSERKCEELSAELWNLEQRLMEPQRRLLEHTAGILQLTHKASKKNNRPPNGLPVNGIPGSPESLYTYTNSRNSMEPPPDDNYFEDDGLYQRSGDYPDGGSTNRSAPRRNPLEIPMKSPVREQNTQLREESDRLREENNKLKEESTQLRAQSDALNLEVDALQRENYQRLRSISQMEQKLDGLNKSLRDVIVQFNPSKNGNYKAPPYGLTNGSDRALEPGDMIGSQFDYLERALGVVQEEQQLQAMTNTKQSDTAAAAKAKAAALSQTEERIEFLNQQIWNTLTTLDPAHPQPPQSSSSGLDDQLDYLQDSLRVVGTQLTLAAEASTANVARKQDDQQAEAVLMGLWEIIQTGFAGIQQKKEERRRTRIEKGLEDDEDEASGDEFIDTNEPYSLSAFSTKVQWLYTQATSLKEQKSVLKRQIKQQRELGTKSDSDKDNQLKKLEEDLQTTRSMLNVASKDATEAQGALGRAIQDLEMANKAKVTDDSAAKVAQDLIKERDAQIVMLEKQLAASEINVKDLGDRLADFDATIASKDAQIDEAKGARYAVEIATQAKVKEILDLEKVIKEKDEELDQMNLKVVELKTELTIAQAELDGAYGTRAQRAADAAAIKSSSEVVGLQGDVEKLRSELAETLKELENITKETISAEREKLEAEGKLDDALAAKASLESEIQELKQSLDDEMEKSRDKIAKIQEELDTERLKVVPGAAGGAKAGAGASMLSEQFRATMREERKKFQEDLKVSSR
jgi:hypothetical protein